MKITKADIVTELQTSSADIFIFTLEILKVKFLYCFKHPVTDFLVKRKDKKRPFRYQKGTQPEQNVIFRKRTVNCVS